MIFFECFGEGFQSSLVHEAFANGGKPPDGRQ